MPQPQSRNCIPESKPNNFWLNRTGHNSYNQNTGHYGSYSNSTIVSSAYPNNSCESPIVRGVCPIGPMASGTFSSKNR